MNDYNDLADLAESGHLKPKPGTIKRGAEASDAARHALLEATGAATLDQVATLAMGRPKLGTHPAAGPSPIWRVRASAELYAATATVADNLEITVSELVRDAVADYLQTHEGQRSTATAPKPHSVST